MAVSTLVGGTVGGQPVVLVVVTALWALGAGLLTALGPPGHGHRAPVHGRPDHRGRLRDDPAQALGRAALVLAGGLLQTLLVVGLWPLRTRGPGTPRGRRGVRRARPLRRRRRHAGPLPTPTRSPTATTALADANPLGQDQVLARFRALLHLAERARVEIAALGRARAQLARAVAPPRLSVVDELLASAERVLTGIATPCDPAPGRPGTGLRRVTTAAAAPLTDPLRGGTALEERCPRTWPRSAVDCVASSAPPRGSPAASTPTRTR